MPNPKALNRIDIVDNFFLTCQYTNTTNSYGFWHHSILEYTTPVLLLQMVVIFLVTRAIYILLRPFNQTTTMAQIIGGAILGPSFFGDDAYFEKLFPLKSRYILRTFAEFGMILNVFMLGVQIDVGLVKHIRKKAVIIGVTGAVMPLLFGMPTFHIVQKISRLDPKSASGIPLAVAVNCMSSFIVITTTLNELKMLNSELGRLASSAAMVSDLFGWFANSLLMGVNDVQSNATLRPIYLFPALFVFYGIMFFVLRPLAIWMVCQTSEGNPMHQNHFVGVLCIVMGLCFLGTCVGQEAALSAFLFGVSLPDGPPLGTQLIQKLELLVSGFFLPVFCAISGIRMEIHLLKGSSTKKLELIIIMAYLGKFTGTFLPCLLFGMSFIKACCLALIMCCRGIIEVAVYCSWKDSKAIDSQIFALLVTNMVTVTGISTTIVGYFYDPSRRYKLDARRAILKTKQSNLRMLVCINKEENVNPVISLLEVSNPSRNSPVTAFVVQLVELKGSVSAFLKPQHRITESISDSSTHIIVNAFNHFQQSYGGNVVVQHFTTIAPYASIHDDICTLALDKRVAIIILPFHKQWGISGMVETCDLNIQHLNNNVLDKAPCSVGVLVHRGQTKTNKPVLTDELYHIVVLFIGGDDDREALAYSNRMVKRPNITLTVIWFRTSDSNDTSIEEMMHLDNQSTDELNYCMMPNKITFREEIVKDGMDTTKAIGDLKDNYDLFIVGRNHDPDSKAFRGLSEWLEYPELGIMGDTLVNSSDQFSVLVVQQQPVEGSLKVKNLVGSR